MRIESYAKDNQVSVNDKLIGTDGDKFNKTKNFPITGLANFVLAQLQNSGVVFRFSDGSNLEVGTSGYFFSEGAVTNKTNITNLYFSKTSYFGEVLTELFTSVGSNLGDLYLGLTQQDDTANYGYFNVANVTDEGDYFTIEADLRGNLFAKELVHNKNYALYFDLASSNEFSISIEAGVFMLRKNGALVDQVDMSVYLDDTNLARITGGTVDANGLATFTRDDTSTFTMDFSPFLNQVIPQNTSDLFNDGDGVSPFVTRANTYNKTEVDNKDAVIQGQVTLLNGLYIENDDAAGTLNLRNGADTLLASVPYTGGGIDGGYSIQFNEEHRTLYILDSDGNIVDSIPVSILIDQLDIPEGKSAYEVAVDNGFVGTEPEWLSSLIGAQGATGPQGPQGIQGEVGLTGPQGAQGEQGIKGDQGIQGVKGDQGDKGNDGTSITILGNYATISELQTAHPTGNVGDGYTIPDPTSGLKHLWIWDATNTVWNDVGQIQGPRGEDGVQGIQGVQGKSLEYFWNGTQLGVRVEGDSTYTYTELKGAKGDTGSTGLQGPAGPQGIQGIQGPTGEKGDTGDTGLTGAQGPQGDTGLQGPIGLTGAKGDQGEQGIQGPIGLTGPAGSDADVTAGNIETALGYVPEEPFTTDESLNMDSLRVLRANISVFDDTFIWTTGDQLFNLSFEPTYIVGIYNLGVRLHRSQYTFIPPTTIEVLDTLDSGDLIEVVYEHFGVEP